MSIRPLALRIENFGSFRAPQTFRFPEEPGLYFMQGKNESEPRLTGNGTGKSTIWKALTWLHYGVTPEGLKAGDVCNWNEKKGVRVEFDFIWDDDEDVIWTMARTWNPNTWTLRHLAEQITDEEVVDLAKDPQNPVHAEIRLDLQAWLCAVLMAQGEAYFLDMKRDAQAALFGAVMDLDGWIARADRASQAASEQDRVTRGLERDLADTRGRLSALDHQDPAADARRWEEKRKERLDQLEQEHADLVKRRKGLAGAAREALARAEVARQGLAAVQPNQRLEDERDDAALELRKVEDEITRLVFRLDEAEVQLRKMGKDTNCPTCGQPLGTHDWQREEEALQRKVRDLDAEIKQWREKANPKRARVRVLDEKLRESDVRRQKARDALDDAERAAGRARSDLEACDKSLDRIEDMHEEVTKERNPHADSVERNERLRQDCLRAEREILRRLDESERQFRIKSFWVRGFKDIRLREIASALGELELEVNSCVTALGLVDWELEFRVDREGKSGKVQRGFSVFVRAPASKDKLVPWEAWSGGEKQRLRLAANMGLGNLIRARTGCGLPLEVWDEPTNGLSPEGKDDLFAALASRARDEGRLIFLVDHQAHDFGGFAGTCLVVKTPSGSRLRTSWARDV